MTNTTEELNIQQDENDIFHLGIKALIKNSQGKILLLHDTPRKLIDGTERVYWDLPGGRVNKKGDIEETLKREIQEEMRITEVEIVEVFDAAISNFRTKFQDESLGLCLIVYLCKIAGDAKITLSDEHSEYDWFSPKEAAKLLKVKYKEQFTKKIEVLK